MPDIHEINAYIQAQLRKRGVFEATATEVAAWLDSADLLRGGRPDGHAVAGVVGVS